MGRRPARDSAAARGRIGGDFPEREAAEKRPFTFAPARSNLFLFRQLDGVETAMVSSVLVLLLAAASMQSDTTRTAREAYTRCLRAFETRSVESRMAVDAFNTALATACTAEKTAYHDAVVRRETATRATRATAEQSATEELNDALTNSRERFEMAMAPE